MRHFFVPCLTLLLSHTAFAQQFGGNPPSHKWKQIDTDSARVIFPAGLDSQANRIASIVHYLAANNPAPLGSQLKKINIVLQNQTVIPNGYVQLGPYRSEFYMTPEMNSFNQGTIPWGDQLALHEYRHVQQFNNFNNGLSKLMRTLFGQEGYALAINASVPDWFYEGDAVYIETVLTKQGRGRLPLFVNSYPSLWRAGKKFSWMKLRNGSFKDYVPNHYYLGYLLVNYGHHKYGADFWTKVTRDASAYKGLFYTFQSAIKRHAGISYKQFREAAFQSYKEKMPATTTEKEEFVFPVRKDHVVSYYFPYAAGTDSLLYLKTSLRKRPAFFIKDVNGEHKLKVRDISIDEQFSYRNGKIVYASLENDPRWLWKDYSVIKLLDVKTGKQRKLTSKSKYFTPDISADGSRVAAVRVNEKGQSELHILNSADGSVLQTIRSAEINLFTDPKFIDEQSLVTAVRLHDGKMALATAEIATGNTMRLTPPSFNVVGYPCVYNGVIYFTASYNGNDDVFALRMRDNKIFQVTKGPLGNYYVNAGNGKVTWSAFTAEGYQLKQINEADIDWNEIAQGVNEKFAEPFPVSGENAWGNVLSNIPQRSFATKKYKKGTGLFNFHSWRPYYEDPIFTFSVYGENVLNTYQTELYYLYNQDEKTSAVGFSGVYGGWFPYINFGAEYTFNREMVIDNRTRQWNQLDSRIGLSVPLNKTSGQTFKSFNIASYYVRRNEFNKGFYKDSLGNTSFSYLQHSIHLGQQVQRAVQHIFPRFAGFLSATYRHAITEFEGYQFNTTTNVYLPGLLSTHNLQLSAFFQQIDTLQEISFGNRFPYSRGFTSLYFTRMWRLSANYHLPLVYPDWGFGNMLYFQRVRGNLFYDFTKVFSRNKQNSANQRSVGVELFLDTKWWNQYPLTFGFRVSRLLDDDLFSQSKGTMFEFILPVSILPR
jgi:hypothetical protein